VTLPCESIFERTASRDGHRPALTIRDKVSFNISYTGDGWITLPSGNWEVKRLAFKMTPEDPSRIASEGESLFSPQLGVIVKTHRTGENTSAHSKAENTNRTDLGRAVALANGAGPTSARIAIASFPAR
jgi:hypothetical protein